MILVDSSVWVDFFQGNATKQTRFLQDRLGSEPFAIGDLMLAEVLQGFASERDFKQAESALSAFPVLPLVGERIAREAAAHYRSLRKRGVTIRGTIDVLIASYCLHHKLELLYTDRDFDAMVKHLGLRKAI